MSHFVKTNEDYLLCICAQSQTSVTFYNAYLRLRSISLKVSLAGLSTVSYGVLQKVVKGSRWLYKECLWF